MKLAWFRHAGLDAANPLDDTAGVIGQLGREHSIAVVTRATAHDFVWRHFRHPYDLCVFELDNTADQTLSDITAGGAPRPVAHVTRLQESFRHAQPALGYGLTETNAVGCSNFWGNYAAKPASTGRAQAPLVEVAILDDAGALLPAEQVGEVAIRSAANVRGYWNDAGATAAAFSADGWFKTGDLGRLDEDGYLFIVDRKKDLVIRGGENISCQEVEAAIYAHPAVSEAAVFGVADERLGEVPAAVIWSESGIDAATLREFVAERVARFKVPEHVWLAAEPLPKLGTGKIDKVSLRARYAAAG